jgi:hypothetical protein
VACVVYPVNAHAKWSVTNFSKEMFERIEPELNSTSAVVAVLHDARVCTTALGC